MVAATEVFNKEIRRFKLAINSGCPLRCEYCFIDKEANEVLSPEAAERAVDLALNSPGEEKKMLVYGGEPFLHFPLVKRVVLYARRREKALKKKLAISVATSGIMIKEEQLAFLAEQRSQLAVSIDGDKASHDRFRVLKGGKGSFDKIRANLDLILRAMPKRNVIALLGVHPAQAGLFFKNFKFIAALGFENVNIEVIHGFPWAAADLAKFKASVERAGEHLLASVVSDSPLFLESTYKDLRGQQAGLNARLCPFNSYLEVFPSGEYSFYPFPFVSGLKERPSVVVGSVREGFAPRYRDCAFDARASLCRGCLGEYYRLNHLSIGSEAFAIRHEISRGIGQRLLQRYGGTPLYDRYLKEVSLRDSLGFSE